LNADETPTSAAQPEAEANGAPADVPAPEPAPERPAKSLTIGAVCKALQQEFPDISISKIRYLEDQKLLSPRRTPGGYRLYSSNDVSRLRTILRLQRDEFLPLRVIRQELASGRTEADIAQPAPAGAPGGDARPGAALRRITFSLRDRGALYSLEEVVEETGAREELIRELENFGIVQPEKREGRTVYDETDREIVRAANELSRVGVGARNLRVFRSSADREANLLEALLGPSLRSRNPDRRKEALESLESLAATVSHLKHLLLVRDLRRLAGN
jgi:DNA-binding transcriptional MerR regulator